ncbi:hypothetical protein [Acaryochloris sp. CCMEE 5410]|uniref:hypothetical protein n=1 Tax=Acaryochloris sp. CCMEE 5410 TaxID=310037 RepID=UPI0002483AD5|nr:hypothetical protein [Acaryochloris sp. CCMEE 5410]KAI9129011.1 hypothetical protein ON05_037240 [Acaryochloris sp. CCMEE 5410]KAI9129441.1 hypothetical protein ON05_035630 [Acaryochloris sp. CCMEE 5410]
MDSQEINVSLNHAVKVKLTPEGYSHLHRKGTVPPEADREGFSKWALWQLFESFGEAISIGSPTYFEGGIFIDRHELGL